jgi:hypothetical protein
MLALFAWKPMSKMRKSGFSNATIIFMLHAFKDGLTKNYSARSAKKTLNSKKMNHNLCNNNNEKLF